MGYILTHRLYSMGNRIKAEGGGWDGVGGNPAQYCEMEGFQLTADQCSSV